MYACQWRPYHTHGYCAIQAKRYRISWKMRIAELSALHNNIRSHLSATSYTYFIHVRMSAFPNRSQLKQMYANHPTVSKQRKLMLQPWNYQGRLLHVIVMTYYIDVMPSEIETESLKHYSYCVQRRTKTNALHAVLQRLRRLGFFVSSKLMVTNLPLVEPPSTP